MNKYLKHKDLIDNTIISIKDRYPNMDTFLNLDYNSKFDIIHHIIEIHEESMIEVSEEGIPIQLPFIGRLLIKEGKILYNEILEQYLIDNNIKSKKDLTDEDKINIMLIMKKSKLAKTLANKALPVETKVLTFKMKC